MRVASWSGFYIGANAGSALARNKTHNTSTPNILLSERANLMSKSMAGVRERAHRAGLGRGTAALSDILLTPDSVRQIRAIEARAADTPAADALLRQIIVAPSETRIDH